LIVGKLADILVGPLVAAGETIGQLTEEGRPSHTTAHQSRHHFLQQCTDDHLHPILQNNSKVRTVILSNTICLVTFGRVMVDAIIEFNHKLLGVVTSHTIHVSLIDDTGQPLTAGVDVEQAPIHETLLQEDPHPHVRVVQLPQAVPVLKGGQLQAEHVVLHQQPQAVAAASGHQICCYRTTRPA
jgi:hypothetical protein